MLLIIYNNPSSDRPLSAASLICSVSQHIIGAVYLFCVQKVRRRPECQYQWDFILSWRFREYQRAYVESKATKNLVIIDLCWHIIAAKSRLAKKHERPQLYVFYSDDNETHCPFSKGILYVGIIPLTQYFVILCKPPQTQSTTKIQKHE